MPKPARPAEEQAASTAPGPGFQGWAEADEARLERPASARRNPEALIAEARVVYLGSARRKTVVLPGALITMQREDDTEFFVPAPRETEGNIAYDFSRLDTRGRPNTLRLTKTDKRPFAICRHIGHLAWFYNKVTGVIGEDQSPEFDLRAPVATIERVKAYIESTRRNVAQNR